MQILTKNISSISELKANPMKVLKSAGGEAIAILNYNKPAFYCVPIDAYDNMQNGTSPQWYLDILYKLEKQEHTFIGIDEVMKKLEKI